MVSQDICKTCRHYSNVRYTFPMKKKDKAFRVTWRCRIDVPPNKHEYDYTKVLCDEENPARGCPKLMEHAIACGMSNR